MVNEIKIHIKCRTPDVLRKRTHHYATLESSVCLESASAYSQQNHIMNDFCLSKYLAVSPDLKFRNLLFQRFHQ